MYKGFLGWPGMEKAGSRTSEDLRLEFPLVTSTANGVSDFQLFRPLSLFMWALYPWRAPDGLSFRHLLTPVLHLCSQRKDWVESPRTLFGATVAGQPCGFCVPLKREGEWMLAAPKSTGRLMSFSPFSSCTSVTAIPSFHRPSSVYLVTPPPSVRLTDRGEQP